MLQYSIEPHEKWCQFRKSLATNPTQEELLDFEGEPQMGLWQIFSFCGCFLWGDGAFKHLLLPTTES